MTGLQFEAKLRLKSSAFAKILAEMLKRRYLSI